ncbi:LppU/SCO3897 family protein [Streptacidiphilus rugosus]|uniref:LppU/SCO3897 family protein n=1 Tax=Streptacidiphilus rugosus TaxID=405783 RepID=UPI0006913C05|nr:hypothetical protein [Streptacidiphilus rugosus]
MTTPPPAYEAEYESNPYLADAEPPAAVEEAPKPKSGLLKQSLVFLGVGALVLGGLLWASLSSNDPTAARAGDCVQNAGTDAAPDVTVVDCASSAAQYKVIKTFQSSDMNVCKDVPGSEAAYVQTQGGYGFVLCLGQK